MRFGKLALSVLTVALLGLDASVSQAGILLSLVSTTNSVDLSVNPVQQFVIGVRAQADSGTQNLFGYTIPVDLRNPVGTDTPPGWTVLSVTRTPSFGGNLSTSSLNPAEGDVSMSETRIADPAPTTVPFTFTTTPVTLFEFTVEVSKNGAVNGTYFASIVNNGSLFSLNNTFDGGVLPANQISFGTVSIDIVGVPEPSSFALLGFVAIAGFCARTRYRKTTLLSISK